MVATSVILACCGPAAGTGSFNGTVDGKTFVVRDAIFYVVRESSSGLALYGDLTLSDQPGLCSKLSGNTAKVGETRLVFSMRSGSGIDRGEYPVTRTWGPGRSVVIGFGNACNETGSGGTDGRLVVDALAASRGGGASGTFEITLKGTQTDMVTGTFSAPYCDFPLGDNPFVTCRP